MSSSRGATLGRHLYAAGAAAEARLRGLETTTVDVDGLPVSVHRAGRAGPDAPVVVMLHGYSADKNVWSRFAGHLVKDHRVLVPDLAGHGRTPFVSGSDYSARAQAELVLRLLDAQRIGAAHVVGNSMGGFVAATLALHHPDRVLSLGLSDAAGVRSPEASEMDRRRARGENPFVMDDPSGFDDFYTLTMSKPPPLPRLLLAGMAADYVERRDSLAEIFTGFVDVDLLDDDLASITAPTLVMWGEEDQIVSPSAAGVWMAGLPDAELVTYPGVGHLPMVEIPRRSARDYRRFVRGVDPGARPG